MKTTVATFNSGNIEIWDWRNMPMIERLKIAWSLVISGVVEIEWGQKNEKIFREKYYRSKGLFEG